MIKFAVEFHWTPAQVWALRYHEYRAFADGLDELFEQRAREAAKVR